jgi:hypothetical protein
MVTNVSNYRKVFFFFMSFNICLAIFIWFVLPETKKVRLEEMDALFGGVNHTTMVHVVDDKPNVEKQEDV